MSLHHSGHNKKTEGEAVFDHMGNYASVDCAGEFAFNTHNDTHNADSDADVPLTVKGSE